LENRLIGLPNYHTSAAWLWLGACYAIALGQLGQIEKAMNILQVISQVILRDGKVHEIYMPSGVHFSNAWYKSEAPLTWSAGMFLYALWRLRNSLHLQKDAFTL
jgi:hypothetical protein